MTEYLGDVVLNLTGDLGDLASVEQRALAMTATNMDLMSKEVQKFVTSSAQAGQLFDRTFLQPLLVGFNKLDLAVIEASTSFGILTQGVREADSAVAHLTGTITGDAAVIERALDSISSSAERSAAGVIAAAKKEEAAIDDLRNAYLELAAAERGAALARGDLLRAGLGATLGAGGMSPIRVPNLDPTTGGGGSGAYSFSGSRSPYSIGSIQNPQVVVIEAGQFGNLGGRGAALTQSANDPGPAALGATAGQSSDMATLVALLRRAGIDPTRPQAQLGPGPQPGSSYFMPGGYPGGRTPGGQFAPQHAPIYGPPPMEPGGFVRMAGSDPTHPLYTVVAAGPGGGAPSTDLVRQLQTLASDQDALLRYLRGGEMPAPRAPLALPVRATAGPQGQAEYGPFGPYPHFGAPIAPTGPRVFVAGAGGEQTIRLDAGQFAAFMAEGAASRAAYTAPLAGRPVGPWVNLGPALGGGGGGGGMGGGGIPPIAIGPAGPAGPGGGGGGAGLGAILMSLLWGQGHAGFMGGGRFGFGLPVFGAGFGSLGSFAGLGPEHLLMTALGIGGSAATAAGGAGALALGTAGNLAVGAGSNAAVMTSTIADTKTLSTAVTQLQTAQQNQAAAQAAYTQTVAKFGATSTQATNANNALTTATGNLTTAQQNYNATIQSLGGMTAGVQAELLLGKNVNALNMFWDKATSQARVAASNILEQIVGLGNTMVPLVANAALQNLTIINNDIKPLFAWLEGPQGLAIWNTLEDNFRTTLPTAIDAGTNGIEALLRIIQVASGYTGGFITYIDKLMRELNGMSNIQFSSVIGRLVDDFRVWEGFVKALTTDLYLLFTQDAATGRTIIETLTGMLTKLGDWERSVQGRQDLHTLFSVHLAEVEQLLRILPLFVNSISPIYMALAPAFTKAFTTMAKAILDVVQALESIPGGTWVVGIGLILGKLGLLSGVISNVGKALGILGAGEAVAGAAGGAGAVAGGAGLATEAAAGAGGAAAAGGGVRAVGGILSRIPGLSTVAEGTATATAGAFGTAAYGAEAAGFAGLAEAITSAGIAVAPVAAGILPLLAAVGGVYGLVQLLNVVGGSPSVKVPTGVTATPVVGGINTRFAQMLQQPGGLQQVVAGAQPHPAATEGAGAFGGNPFLKASPAAIIRPEDVATTKQAQAALQQWVDTASNASKVSQLNVFQLESLRNEGQALAQIFPKDAEVINRYVTDINHTLMPLKDMFATITNRWQTDSSTGLRSMLDIFGTNTKLIANVVGLNSAEGRDAMRTNVEAMVSDVTSGMNSQTISVTKGMAAINDAIKQGVKDGALTWKQGLSEQLNTVTDLYNKHLISTKTLTSNLQQIYSAGFANIKADTQAKAKAMWDYLEAQHNQGNLTANAMNQKYHQYQQAANAQEAKDMAEFAGSVTNALGGAATATSQAMILIAQATDSVIKAFGGTTIPIPQLVRAQQILNNPGVGPSQRLSAGQTGAMIQFGQAGQRGVDSIRANFGGMPIMVAPGEVGLVLTGQQQGLLNTRLADMGGLSGMFGKVNQPHAAGWGPGWAMGGWAPGWATGGYVYPLPSGTTLERTDQGVDARMPVGSPIGPIGPAKILGTIPNWYSGQPLLYWQLTSGPDAGKYVYLAEQITTLVSAGQTVGANQAVARFAPSGTGIEMGWATGSGSTLAMATTGYKEGQATAAGSSFRAFLSGLSHGQVSAGGAGIGQVTAPQVHGKGALADLVKAAVGLSVKDANDYIAKQTASLTPAGGTFSGGVANVAVGNILQIAQSAFASAGLPYVAYIVSELLSKESSGGRNEPPSGPLRATGPFQVTPPTFAQYDPGGNIDNPADNALAAARYIKSRYGSLAHMAQVTGLFGPGYVGYHGGGMVPFAGAFGGGGVATASGPTMAMFGDRGAETAVFLPHAQTGAMLAGKPVTGYTNAGTPYSGNGPSRMYYYPGQGWVTGAQVDVQLGHTTPTTSTTSSTTKEQTGSLKDIVRLLGVLVGEIKGTAKTLKGEGLPTGHPLNLVTGLTNVNEKGMTQVTSTLNKFLDKATANQAFNLATGYAAQTGLGAARATGPGSALLNNVGSLFGRSPTENTNAIQNVLITHALAGIKGQFGTQQAASQNLSTSIGLLQGVAPGTPISPLAAKSLGLSHGQAQAMMGQSAGAYAAQAQALTGQLGGYNQDAKRLQTLYQESLKTHNKKLQASLLNQLDAVTQAQLQAQSDLAAAQVNQVNAVYTAAQQTAGTQANAASLITVLAGLNPGTSLAGMGISPAALAQMGLDPGTAQALTGAGLAASTGTENALLGQQQGTDIGALNQLLSMMPGLTGDALNQAQQNVQQLVGSIAGLTQQIQANQAALEQNTMQLGTAAAASQQNAYGILGQIQNLAPGTNLAALGLSPAVLAQVGAGGGAGGLLGSGLTYLQSQQQLQNGMLTPAQLQAAQAGVASQNQLLGAQQQTDIGTLNQLQAMLPSLSGTGLSQAQQDIQTLVAAILSLSGDMQANSTALASLTQATNANTTATGQMTGTVAYQYQSQNFLASTTPTNVGVGV